MEEDILWSKPESYSKVGRFQCPNCKSMSSKVLNSRVYGDGRIRHRKCKDCDFAYETLETVFKK